MWVLMGKPSGFRIVEFGSGKGLLCRDILCYLRKENPDFFGSLFYQMVGWEMCSKYSSNTRE
ncbi:MAG: SAM-dependent methyltransferase [Syntrophobacterales bacterium]|nr:MAG: SAM-dependent methyltransferase [Syntrophobacterales bacterium]